MTAIPERLTNITTGNEVVYKIVSDANIRQSCGGNRAVYRIVDTRASANGVLYPALIPFRPPCNYLIEIRWAGISSTGNQVGQYLIYQMLQTILGSPPASSANSAILNSNVGVSLALLYSTPNTLDVQLNFAALGGNTSYVVEIEVFSDQLF